jgi:hypothetical protein
VVFQTVAHLHKSYRQMTQINGDDLHGFLAQNPRFLAYHLPGSVEWPTRCRASAAGNRSFLRAPGGELFFKKALLSSWLVVSLALH